MLRIAGALILVAAVASFVAAPRLFSSSKSQAPAKAAPPIVATTTDGPALAWPMFAPERAPRAGKRPALRPERSEAPNWKGLSLSVAETGKPSAVSAELADVAGAADLAVDLSPEERRALMAQARRDETTSIAPAGYVPGIVVLTAGGGHGDGICR